MLRNLNIGRAICSIFHGRLRRCAQCDMRRRAEGLEKSKKYFNNKDIRLMRKVDMHTLFAL